MGSGRHSSKRKSSSSSALKKKKRYKDTSKKKSKSDRHKSKKPYLRGDSVSYSDDDSASDSSESYSSLDDGKRSKRRGRHQARMDLNGRKRRAERNDDEDDARKHKRSKRIRDTDERKKRREKKRRRKPRVSSLSSRSRSCSACGSSDGCDQEFERTELRSEIMDRETKDQGKNRGGNESRYRSRSFCSCSSHSDSGRQQSEEGVIHESSLRRLRSVITVAKRREDTEGMASDRDALKDEIVYDHDDYPSSRNNDGNDGVSTKEASHHRKSGKPRSLEDQNEEAVASDVRIPKIVESGELDREQQDGKPYGIREGQVNNFFKENKDEVSTSIDGSSGENLEAILRQKALEAVTSDVRTTKFLEIGKLHAQQHDRNYSNVGGGQVTHTLEENKEEVSTADDGSNGNDLEAVLRQKALENLRKFRGKVQVNAKIPGGKRGNCDGEVKQLSIHKTDLVQDKYEKRGLGLTDATSIVGKTSMSVVRRDSTPYTPKGRKDLDKSSIPKTATVQHEPEKEVALQLASGTSKVDQISKGEVGRDLTPSVPNVGKDLDAKANAPGVVKLDGILPPSRRQLIHSSGKKLVPSSPSEKRNAVVGANSDKSNLSTMVLKKESLETNKNLKQMPTSREPSLRRMLTPLETGQHNASKGSDSLSQDGKIVPDGSERLASCEPSTPGKYNSAGQSSNDRQSEVDDGSQFQQKTMSVVRGGELVQVSYKVYIPKKAPALARRQLKR
ncbi:hypothetical protein Ancab_025485 [Ancistrocladus abbreviatus]